MFIIFLYILIILFNSPDIKNIPSSPNIIFIVADDLGWNDVSWHNSDILTPNLESLGKDGVFLEHSYVQPMCTPSRVAFMTGYYPFRVGLQHGVLDPLKPAGVPLHFPFLSQILQKSGYITLAIGKPLEPTGLPTTLRSFAEKLLLNGYQTYLVGKWHLGFCNWLYTPTFRGFQNFFGYYNGEETYYSHMTTKNSTPDDTYFGYDFRQNTSVDTKCNGTYSTFIFVEEAEKIIQEHNPSSPLFLYLAFQSPHAPLEVPSNYSDLYPQIKNKARKTFSGMVTALDEGVGRIIRTLKDSGLYDNSVIIFTTDNGGQNLYGGNNWPLRGNKATLWEGGTRGPAFIHSPLLKKKNYTSNLLIHAVDWFPTILSIAGISSDIGIDGIDQWHAINSGQQVHRKEFVYNIDNTTKYGAAIRFLDFKLIVGDPGIPSGWIPPSQVMNTSSEADEAGVLKELNKPYKDLPYYQLFNLTEDPNERNDVTQKYPDIVDALLRKLQHYEKSMVPSIHLPNDPKGNPSNWGGIFCPGWCDPIY